MNLKGAQCGLSRDFPPDDIRKLLTGNSDRGVFTKSHCIRVWKPHVGSMTESFPLRSLIKDRDIEAGPIHLYLLFFTENIDSSGVDLIKKETAGR